MLGIKVPWRERRTHYALIALVCAIAVALAAAIVFSPAGRWRHVVVADADRLLALYDSMNYRLQPIRHDSAQVPRIDVLNMPADWPDIASVAKRKSGFFRTLLPLVLIANQRIADDRARVLELKQALDGGNTLGSSDHTWLNELAARYGIHSDGDVHPSTIIDKLLPRVDGIPPSLALAQAAIESGWGRSRFTLEGNALFGQWTFDGNGMKPARAAEDAVHGVARFDSLLESVEAYMLNLNSQGAYADLRKIRAAQRAQGHVADGLTLASTLMQYSEEGAGYPTKLDSIIRANQLSALDRAILNLENAGIVVATR